MIGYIQAKRLLCRLNNPVKEGLSFHQMLNYLQWSNYLVKACIYKFQPSKIFKLIQEQPGIFLSVAITVWTKSKFTNILIVFTS